MEKLLTFTLLSAALVSCNLGALNGENKQNETYGPNQRNKLDMYFPLHHDSTTAVVVLIHGGAWVAGNKTDWAADFINMIKDQGFAVAAINYRYADGDFRHQMQDVQMSINYINSKAGEWKIGENRFALIGASAGAHLSLLYTHGFDSLNVVKAAVSMAGPTDMSDSVFHQYANNYFLGYVFPQFLGATWQANPQVYRQASPVNYHRPTPTLLLHGSVDNLVPPSHSQMMFDTLHAYSITADTTFFSTAGHDVLGPNGIYKNQLYNEVKNWLVQYLH